MAYLKLYKDRLAHNYRYLDQLFRSNNIDWAAVTKLLCGNEKYLEVLLDLGVDEVCDSRISNLETIKWINPEVQTVYIKPPALRDVERLIQFADVSFNTESTIIKALSKEAGKQNKTHKVIIMIELGDLREGIMGENLMAFYEAIFNLPNLQVVGIGANLTCLHGVLPSQDKLIQLSLYKQLIEAKFDKKIPWVTGGTSVVIPLLLQKQLPSGINHFRVGETLYFGNNIVTEEPIQGMETEVIKLFSEIIEITKKPKVPIGTRGTNVAGEEAEIKEEDYGKMSYRAILDVGLLDLSPDYLIAEDERVEIVNASSDMMIVDLGDNKTNYRVGDEISFKLKYMGALGLLNSDYIDKEIG